MAGALALAAALTAAGDATAQHWQPRPPSGQSTPEQITEARERYERGVKLYEVEGDVVGALIELKKAYDIAPNHRILFNIGQVARTARDYVTSLRAFEAYLAQGGGDGESTRRAEVSSELETLRGLVANLVVEVDRPGAAIVIDDVDVGRAPLSGAVLVNAGRHRVSASLEGRTATRSVEVGGRERITVNLEIPAAQAGAPSPVAPPSPPRQQESSGPSPYVWIGWGAAVALVGGAVVTGVLALDRKSTVEETTFVGATPPEELESDRSTGRTLAIASDVLTGAAVVVAGISLYFTLSTMGSDEPAQAAGVRPVAGAPPRVVVGHDRVTVHGSF